MPGLWYLVLLPAGEVDVVAQEVRHPLVRHLTLQRLQQVGEPLEGLRLRTQPVEVDLGGPRIVRGIVLSQLRDVSKQPVYLLGEDFLLVLDVLVPDRLEDGRKRSHADPGAHQHHHLVTEHVLAGRPEGTVDGHPAHGATAE